MSLSPLHPAVASWFSRELGEPSPPQRDGWPPILRGEHTLIAAPTGSGKTLAAFLCAIDALVREAVAGGLPDETRVLYVSPLKALGNDIEKNLQAPLAGVEVELTARGLPAANIRTLVRTGDTPQKQRAELRKKPPHIVVTTPESLYVLLTSDSGRRALRTVRTVIVDEIHALVGDLRGAHLSLSLARLDALTERPAQRIGLSATQSPIAEVARFLVRSEPDSHAVHDVHDVHDVTAPACTIVDHGHKRALDLAIELPGSPLEAVMSHEVWDEIYERLAELIRARRTTLVFVNTRRLAERVCRHLGERLGEARVAAHHGSLSREHRLRAEQRLKAGELSALVATASLELGIDVGSVDLVCQIGSTRSIASFLQRVGRSGHRADAKSVGRIFPLSRDELAECVALLAAVRRGELDQVSVVRPARDILAQQLVATVACEEWDEEALYALVRRNHPYRALPRADFDAVIDMLCEGFATARGRRSALLHHDRVHGKLRARKGAKLTAVTCGGAIPDNADYAVRLSPENTLVGTLNEDFAIESQAGDVFQLGNTSWRILRIEPGVVRVEDAKGAPPNLPFWLGEAPGRSLALSASVSRLRKELDALLPDDPREPSAEAATKAAVDALAEQCGSHEAAAQVVAHLGAAKAALSVLPSDDTLVAERFFDEAGGMQLVIHVPLGSRHNRAFGLALRKRFCRSFNFELQAAATEDAIVLSLGPSHSFPLTDLREFLKAKSVREVLVQALLDAPMFETRFRWSATRSLAVKRFQGGRKTPPPILRMRTNDLLSVVFPDQQACLENIQGEREIPDHPLVNQTIEDCLHDAMDIEALEQLLARLESGELRFVVRDLTEPSVLAAEVLGARPYAFLDDAPLEERRTQAVISRRFMDPKHAADLGKLDQAAIERVTREAFPSFEAADELHDALVTLGCMTAREAVDARAQQLLAELSASARASRLSWPDGHVLYTSAEHVPLMHALYPDAKWSVALEAPLRDRERTMTREDALLALVQARANVAGPVRASQLAHALRLPEDEVYAALCTLESRGLLLRGRFSEDLPDGQEELCERGLLARIHRLTVDRLRREIEPVSPQVLMRFLCTWQHVLPELRARRREGLRATVEQLAGFEARAGAFESDLLPARVHDYDRGLLDELCLSGEVRWSRLSPPTQEGVRGGPLRSTSITLADPQRFAAFRAFADESGAVLSANAERVRAFLHEQGASFLSDVQLGTGLLPSALEDALAELVAVGLATSDSFAGLRALLVPSHKRSAHPLRRARGRSGSSVGASGRFSLLRPSVMPKDTAIEQVARTVLARYGVVFRKLLERERLPPWRELLAQFRRLEARGEIRGGRFVEGFSGEHFALPEAVPMLRSARKNENPTLLSLSGADPLNVLGLVLPGERLSTLPQSRFVLQNGVVLGTREAGETKLSADLSPELALRTKTLLVRPDHGASNAEGSARVA